MSRNLNNGIKNACILVNTDNKNVKIKQYFTKKQKNRYFI